MPLTACTIQQVLSTDNPNEGRVKINNNFDCLQNTVSNLQIAANTGTTIVSASTNIGAVVSYSGTAPVYTISVVDNPIFTSLSASSVSADTYFVGSIDLPTYLSASSVFVSGSSGSYSIKANNDSGLDAIGDYSYAEGYTTTASGDSSHAEGRLTLANGLNSHAEGAYTSANGINSHAEGGLTTAVGDQSHAEGDTTTALGTASHAEGNSTLAVGGDSHSEGSSTIASGSSSHAEGSFTIALGGSSHAEGYNTTAYVDYSHAEGYYSEAIGLYSHAEGNGSRSSGSTSHAEGNGSNAYGDNSHAEGNGSNAHGNHSHAEGDGSQAFGTGSHSEGNGSNAYGNYSHSEGNGSNSIGLYSHAEGDGVIASGQSSHSEGQNTSAVGAISHTEGRSTKTFGSFSHAEGDSSITYGAASHAEGEDTIASGTSSHSEGSKTTAFGAQSHAEGYGTTTISNYTHAGGYGSVASGDTSFIHSKNSIVKGNRSAVLGGQNITGTTSDTVYVPYLNLSYIGSGSPITSLAIDSSGMIVSGSSENANEVNLGPVLENTITTPPTSPEDQDRYIVPSGSTGEWSGQTNTIAEWGAIDSVWGYYTATTGDRTIVTTGINAGNVYQYSASSWVQISLVAPTSTPFYIGGTMTDAGSNKTSAIYRPGNLLIGGSSGATAAYKFRVIGQSLLDGISTRMGWTSTGDVTRTNKWYKIFRYRFLTDTYSSETFKLMMTDSGNSNGSGQQVEFNVTIKKQVSSVYCSVLIDQKSKIYENISNNFDVLYNNTTKELSFYYKPTQNYANSSWTVLSNRNYTLTGRFAWDNIYLSASTLSGETADSATIEKKVITYSTISSTGATTAHYGTLAIGDAPTSGSTIDDVLLRSSDGVIKFISQSALTAVNTGRVLYVSTVGNDSTAEVGNLKKPWRNLYSAKSASTSGDTVYVLPGTWTYDNRNSAGNPYNGQVDNLVNLWKDGVTYYFLPGTKIVLYNQTISGSDMYLFRPSGVTYETCTVLGQLEYEQNSTGADTSNGANFYFYGKPISTDVGYTFYSETKTLKSNHCEVIRCEGRTTSGVNTTRITLKTDYEEWNYLGGQSNSGGFYRIDNTGTNPLEFRAHARFRKYNAYYPFYISSNSYGIVNIYGDEIYNSGNNLFLLRNQSGLVNCSVKRIYYTTAYTTFGYYGALVSTQGTGGWTANIDADLLETSSNSYTTGLFYLTTTNNTLNFKGNITTNTIGGTGRFIAATTQAGNTISINGDIDLIGTATTTNVLFQPNVASTINYTGKITGNFGGPVVKTYNGTANINNSFIQFTTDNASAQIFQNGASSSGTCRINSSYIEMRNNTNPLANGSYVKALVNNSTIINSGTGATFSNTTNFGLLQMINSTIMTSGSTSVNYLSAGTPVISSNSVTNANYNIASAFGTFSVINELTY